MGLHFDPASLSRASLRKTPKYRFPEQLETINTGKDAVMKHSTNVPKDNNKHE